MTYYPEITAYGYPFGTPHYNDMDNLHKNNDLFKALPLLEWLPDETLFNLVSRIHILSGHQLSKRTAQTLFGSPQAGTHHDFPNSLDQFELRTNQALGTAGYIAFNHTLLKFYRAFIPLSDSADIVETMRGSSVAHLKFRLGLITSRFRANHPLKACPGCIADDYERYGWAYWHLTHQFPGIWWCDIHNQLLCESLIKSTGVGRFLWYLPNPTELRHWSPNKFGMSNDTQKALSSLSRTIKDLVTKGQNTPWDTHFFWITYRQALSSRGWLTGPRLRFTDMVTDFLSYSEKLRIFPELSTLPTTPDSARAQLGRLLRAPRSGIHPLRHCLLIDWLFGGVNNFYKTRNNSLAVQPNISKENIFSKRSNTPEKDPRELQVIELLQKQGISMRAAAKIAGVDVVTVMAWAAKVGISVSRKPKLLKKGKLEALIQNLILGTDKADAAIQFGVSVETVSRLLRTEPGLQKAWHTARYVNAQKHARSTWSSLISTYPQLGTKLLRSLEPAIYAWLYRNDRDWLKVHSPQALTSIYDSANQPMWDKRDFTLSTEVQRTALYLKQQNPRAPIRLWQLYQLIPELKAKLEVLNRLPLTKRAIERALLRPTNKRYPGPGLF